MVHVLKNHIMRFLIQLYASKYIHFLYIITFLDSLLEGLQGFPTLKQIVSLNIGLKCIISDYNQGHIIWELRTRDSCLVVIYTMVKSPLVENFVHG
jgi:hypothetical protein